MICCFICRIYTPFEHDDSATDVGSKLWMSLANAFILLGAVIVMTIFLIVLYKYRCYKAGCHMGHSMLKCLEMNHFWLILI